MMAPTSATHALLGSDRTSVGVISWHGNELEAWREAKRINSNGGKVKVVPVVDGNLTETHLAEKAELFKVFYERTVKG